MKARAIDGLDPAGPLSQNAARIVAVRLDELCAFVPRVFDRSERQALHDMRIAAKRLRYVLETTAQVFGPYADEAADAAKDLQGLLGDIHDCDVTIPRVEALLAEGRKPSRVAGLAAYLDLLRTRRERIFQAFLSRWAHLERDDFRWRLEDAIGRRSAGTVVRGPVT